MLIVLVEDDHVQADWIIPHLKQGIAGLDVQLIKTEIDFMQYVASAPEQLPRVFIIDEMLRWAERARLLDGQIVGQNPPPPLDHDPQRAGVRIIEMLAQDKRLSTIPVILYTVLEQLDLRYLGLPAHVKSVSKNTPPEDLIAAITRIFGGDDTSSSSR